ncbi:unnamed protein product [Choristocarpus tenellus]
MQLNPAPRATEYAFHTEGGCTFVTKDGIALLGTPTTAQPPGRKRSRSIGINASKEEIGQGNVEDGYEETVVRVVVHEALAEDFGLFMWPSGVVLACLVWAQRQSLRGVGVVEIGAGTSLPGLLAAKLGANVVLTDHADAHQTLRNIQGAVEANRLLPPPPSDDHQGWDGVTHVSEIGLRLAIGPQIGGKGIGLVRDSATISRGRACGPELRLEIRYGRGGKFSTENTLCNGDPQKCNSRRFSSLFFFQSLEAVCACTPVL